MNTNNVILCLVTTYNYILQVGTTLLQTPIKSQTKSKKKYFPEFCQTQQTYLSLKD